MHSSVMQAYLEILFSVLPVFLFIVTGFIFRRFGWLTQKADDSLFKVLMYYFYPCLILNFIVGNDALRLAENLIIPPLLGAATVILGFFIGYLAAKLIGLQVGKGRNTFSFATGIFNYGFIAIPLLTSIYHERSTVGVLLVFNTGIEVIIWTVGILLVSGSFSREAWKKVFNPPMLAFFLGIIINFFGPEATVDSVHGRFFLSLRDWLTMSYQCTIPISLILIGATMADLVEDKDLSLRPRVIFSSVIVRLFVLPFLFLLIARYIPLSIELQRVLLIQSAMPAGMFPIVVARHYSGDPYVAVQVVISTSIFCVLTMPFWVMFGRWYLGI